MADKKPVKKTPQLSLEEYNKIKEKRAKSKLQVHFPWWIKMFLIGPIVYFVFMVVYYIIYIRFVADH